MDFLEHDEAEVALRLVFLSNTTKPENDGASKEERQKQKKALKEARKAGSKDRQANLADALKEAKAKKKAVPGKELEAEVRQGMDIDIGSLASSSNLREDGEKYYLTTAINYTNGNPHIGHAYEGITSDIISRYFRMCGRNVRFQTGTDEHGQKIANTAAGMGLKPIDICNKYAGNFQALNKRLLISNDFYIRTTMPEHYASSQKLWQLCADAGDIYLGNYEGWYNEREETFVSDKDAEAAGFKDTFGSPLKRMSEASYFFRMSKHQAWLIDYLNTHPELLQPEEYRLNLLRRLAEPLGDLSISRTSFKWGIPVPEGFDQNHVMYVWFDALSNYTSGVHALEANHPLQHYWPADIHIIGKDILWFHSVIWPCMLHSAKLPIPGGVFAHGFVAAADGRKMSKSLGNVVDPHDVCDKVPVDTLRWYLAREAPFGGDLAFSGESLAQMHNADLCDTLGNLVHRACILLHKYHDGTMPDPSAKVTLPHPFDMEGLRKRVAEAMGKMALNQALYAVMEATRDSNKFLTDQAPWLIKDEGRFEERLEIVRVILEAVYVLAHFLAPAIPTAATAIFNKVGLPPRPIPELGTGFCCIPVGTKVVTVGNVLFTKLEDLNIGVGEPQELKAAIADIGKADSDPKKGEEGQAKENSKSKKKAKAQPKGNGLAKGGEAEAEQDPFSKIDIRVGRIVKVYPHPDADRLYCEEIDVGEEKPRQIASGLREHYTLEEMEGRVLCVVCNLKAAKLAGFVSEGMVLAAKGEDGKVELVQPPEGSKVGERIAVEGCTGEPLTASQVKKKKAWEQLVPSLSTNKKCVATFGGKPLVTAVGACTTASVASAQIS
ncbi:unnamed protein product [Chrysoparadoxa australica]